MPSALSVAACSGSSLDLSLVLLLPLAPFVYYTTKPWSWHDQVGQCAGCLAGGWTPCKYAQDGHCSQSNGVLHSVRLHARPCWRQHCHS